ILPFTAIIVPFWLVRAMVGWKETFEVFPAILVVGVSFAITQWCWANYVDSNLVDIAGGVISLVVTVIFLKIWHPKTIWRFEHERAAGAATGARNVPAEDVMGGKWAADQRQEPPAGAHYTAGQIFKAWSPFLVLSIFVLCWGLPSIKGWINIHTT